MSEEMCFSCRRPKTVVNCGICEQFFCKNCSQFLDTATFSFLTKIPEELSHTYYCLPCYEEQVEPELESYNEIMDRARKVYFFFNTQRKALPILKRSKDSVSVDTCDDRDETILRLAFLSAQQGFNAIVEAEVVSEKIRNAGYQKSRWTGVGFPAQVNAEKIERY